MVDFVDVQFQIVADFFQVFQLGAAAPGFQLFDGRQPDAGLENLPLGLTMGMILSIPMMLVGAWLIWRALKKPVVAEA